MSGNTFQIPGLGQARPNEQLPADNFAPDLLAAAASIMGEDGLESGRTNGNTQWDQKSQGQQKEGADHMDIDSSGSSTTMTSNDDDRRDIKATISQAANAEEKTIQDTPPSPSVTHALEAALDGMLGRATEAAEQTQQQNGGDAGQEEGQEHPEWEADSSPYESSSESSSDSSSDDDSEDEGGYPLLGIEETARLLMAADGEADGEGDGTGKPKGPGAALRTKNEMPEEVIPKPDVNITPEMKIEQLGNIESIVGSLILIKSEQPGEVQVLDSGSVLCTEDRKVIGALAEVFGTVRSPMYTVGFSTPDEIKELGLATGMPVFYSVDHANYVFTQPLKAAKGTDASNLHDEEVPPDEMEFSDDEKEAEHKRQLKQKKRGGKASRGGRDHNNQPQPQNQASGLNYDEDDDGPYRPLARPANFGEGLPPSLPSLPPRPEAGFSPPRGGRGHGHRGAHRGGRGDFRGRNNRGGYRGGDRRHGHGQRGGSGSFSQFGRDPTASPQSAFSNSPLPTPQNPHLPPPPFGAHSPASSGQWTPISTSYTSSAVSYPPHSPQQAQPQIPVPNHQPPAGNFTFNYPAWNQNQGQQYQYPAPAAHHQPPPPPPQPQPQPQHQAAAGYAPQYVPPAWPMPGAAAAALPPAPPAAAAAAFNPTAFYAAYQQHAQAAQQAPQAQQPQQSYWRQQHQQQQHGGYGQGPA